MPDTQDRTTVPPRHESAAAPIPQSEDAVRAWVLKTHHGITPKHLADAELDSNTVPLQAWGLGMDGKWYSQKQIGVGTGGATYAGYYTVVALSSSLQQLADIDTGELLGSAGLVVLLQFAENSQLLVEETADEFGEPVTAAAELSQRFFTVKPSNASAGARR